MRRPGVALLLLALAGLVACGRLGPPVRSRPTPPAPSQMQPAASGPQGQQDQQDQQDQENKP